MADNTGIPRGVGNLDQDRQLAVLQEDIRRLARTNALLRNKCNAIETRLVAAGI